MALIDRPIYSNVYVSRLLNIQTLEVFNRESLYIEEECLSLFFLVRRLLFVDHQFLQHYLFLSKSFKQICEKFGGIDILISNAGTAPGGSIGEVSDEILRKSFEINFFSHQNCASEAVKIMKKQKNG